MPMKHSQSSQGNRLTRPSPLIYFLAIITMQEFQPFLGDPIPCGPWPEKSFRLFRHLITTIILGFLVITSSKQRLFPHSLSERSIKLHSVLHI